MPMDLEEYNTYFRTRLNLSSTDLAQSMSVRDKDWGGERLSSHNSNDVWSVGSRDWQTSLSDDSGFLLSEDSGMVADSNLMGFDYIPGFLTDSAEFLPVNITTSNVGSTSNPPQPPQSVTVNDKGPQGELAKQMINNSLITDYSSYNTPSSFSKSDEDEILSPESSGIETSCESPVSMSEGNDEVKSHVPKLGMIFPCEEEAYKFYHKYAVEMGFKIRKGKDGVVEDDIGEEIEDESSDRPLSLGKRKLMHKALTVIAKSVAVEKTQKIAEHYLDIAIKEVDDVLKKGHEYLNMNDAEVDHEDVSNTIRVARVERREKVVKDLYLNEGETSKGRMESQIQKKRKSEVREMDPCHHPA
nr:hypothetical protein CFP56_43265 [Quercus suber]